jgi:putative nucleotidyltransferase with HDIG domain
VSAFQLSEDVLAERVASLPALPVIATELLKSFDQADLNVPTLARQISNDQSLAARALRLANSPFYGLAGRVTTINDAIVILGFRAVRSLVLSAVMVQTVNELGAEDQAARGFWRHSVAVAICARGLARFVGECQDTAFTAGLLHDIGRVLLSTCFPEHSEAVLRRVKEEDCSFRYAEHLLLGLDHGIAGGILARQWGFPARIADAIARHHDPDLGEPAVLADVCHGADTLARALEMDSHAGGLVPHVSNAAWERLNPNWNLMSGLLVQAEESLEDTCLALLP